MRLRWQAAALAAMREMAAAAYPDEGCGVLVGQAGDGEVSVRRVTRGANLRHDRARDRYELDPGAIVAAERSARAEGADIVGFWHSHPDHPAQPSAVDTARAWPDYVYVICATTAAGTADVRAWTLDGDRFTEVPA